MFHVKLFEKFLHKFVCNQHVWTTLKIKTNLFVVNVTISFDTSDKLVT